jgi:hypothetical protein
MKTSKSLVLIVFLQKTWSAVMVEKKIAFSELKFKISKIIVFFARHENLPGVLGKHVGLFLQEKILRVTLVSELLFFTFFTIYLVLLLHALFLHCLKLTTGEKRADWPVQHERWTGGP